MLKHLRVKYFLVFIPILFIYITSCKSNDQNEIKETLSQQIEKQKEYIYGYNMDSVSITQDTVKKNQNLSEILTAYNVPFSQINTLVNHSKDVFDVRHIRTNKPYDVISNKDSAHTAKSLIYHPNKLEYIKFNLEDSLDVTLGKYKVDTIQRVVSGVIKSSLYQTLVDNESSPLLAGMLSDVYAWQIDFFGLQKKDSFVVVYEELLVKKEVVDYGKIISAEFTHSGEKFDAYWFEKDSTSGYYDQNGESMRKSFLKAPLKFKRISSKFSYRRLHPVHKVYRAHLGVDYAAPSGTPVVAIGDGKIIKKGYSGGAGNMIKIKHNGTYTTAYLHLSAYAKGLHTGQMVKQGEIIGYVGSTGWSTGPHLDYRVWKDGKNIDPLKMKPVAAKALSKELKADFEIKKAKLDKEMKK